MVIDGYLALSPSLRGALPGPELDDLHRAVPRHLFQFFAARSRQGSSHGDAKTSPAHIGKLASPRPSSALPAAEEDGGRRDS
jgi:hypothetical protein